MNSEITKTGWKKKKKMRFPLFSSSESKEMATEDKEQIDNLLFGSLPVAISSNGNKQIEPVNPVDFSKSGKVSSTLPTGENNWRTSRKPTGKENVKARWQRVGEKSIHTNEKKSTGSPNRSLQGAHILQSRDINIQELVPVNLVNSTDSLPNGDGKPTIGLIQNEEQNSTARSSNSPMLVNVLQHRESNKQGVLTFDFVKSTFGPLADVRMTSPSACRVLGNYYLSRTCLLPEFEKLIASASPVVMTSSVEYSDEISLAELWGWYEEVGAYGLGVRVEPHRNSNGRLPFLAYFVPSLSSVQLFSYVSCNERKGSDDCEVLYQFFEHQRPDQRKPVYDKIKELAEGNACESQTLGDPTVLEGATLRQLHPASWYSVAWYPIYRIPQGALRASFLTYHCLGHVVRRHVPNKAWHLVYPTLGMESYNALGEGWLEGLPRGALDQRLASLSRAAEVFSRGSVSRDRDKVKNAHPDYEFFLSRR